MNWIEILFLCSFIFFLTYKPIIYTIISIIIMLFDFNILRKKKNNYNDVNNKDINQFSSKKTFKNKLKRFYEGLYKYLSFKVGLIPSNHIRMFFYKKVFRMKISKNVVIHYGLEVRAGFNISIGKGSIIGDKCLLDGRKGLVIGNNVNISSNASIYTMQHDLDSKFFVGKGCKVIIEDRSWISSNTVILPGVVVGEGAVLASGAVATKSLEKFSVYGGIPAKKISSRNEELIYEFDGTTTKFF